MTAVCPTLLAVRVPSPLTDATSGASEVNRNAASPPDSCTSSSTVIKSSPLKSGPAYSARSASVSVVPGTISTCAGSVTSCAVHPHSATQSAVSKRTSVKSFCFMVTPPEFVE